MHQEVAESDDLIPSERVGLIVFCLTENRGTEYTTAELAEMVHLQHQSVWAMLCKLSRVLPIRQSRTGWSIQMDIYRD